MAPHIAHSEATKGRTGLARGDQCERAGAGQAALGEVASFPNDMGLVLGGTWRGWDKITGKPNSPLCSP